MAPQPARRAREAYALDRWAVLVESHDLLMQGRVLAALRGYRQVLRGITDLLSGAAFGWPAVSGDPRQPSAASAFVYLRAFFQLTKAWRAWTELVTPVRHSADYGSIPAVVRGHIEAGWWMAHIGVLPYEQVIGGLDAAIAAVGDDDSGDGHRARMALLLANAEANNRGHRHTAALVRAQAAVSLSEIVGLPYFRIRAFEELANAHYNAATMSADDPAHYAACASAQDQGDAVMNTVGPEAWPLSRDYDRGWLYNRLGRFIEAVAEFERGAMRRTAGGLIYDAGRCFYGMGYALLRLGRHDAARISLNRALDLFSDDSQEQMSQDALGAGTRSAQMNGLVLQILGLVDMDEDKLEAALENLELSREHLLAVTNPGPWFDTLTHLIEVCKRLGLADKLARYQAEMDSLRARFNLP